MITISAEQLARAEVLLKNVPNGVSKAVVSALNRAAESARADAVRKVRERYYIKAQDVRSEIKITKATLDNQAAIIHATGQPVPLSKFRVTPAKPPAKRRKNPIIVRVVRGGGGPVKGAFVAQMQSGHIGVFHRAGRARFPIIQRFGPSIPQMLGHESVVTYVEERAQELLESRLEHEIERLLRGVGK